MCYFVCFIFLLLVLIILFFGYVDWEWVYIFEEFELMFIGMFNIKFFFCVCDEDFEFIIYELEQYCDGYYIFKGICLWIFVCVLDCGNCIMNKDFYEVLKVDVYLEIVIQFEELYLFLVLNVVEGWFDLMVEAFVRLVGCFW